jgi:hypothetical protein
MRLYNTRPNVPLTSVNNQKPTKSSYPVFTRFEGFLIGGILAPISLFLGALTLFTLILIAFGKVDYWGHTGRVAVGIFAPSIIILCMVSKRFGNIIFLLWSFLLICIFFFIPVLYIMYYMGLKPILDYLI